MSSVDRNQRRTITEINVLIPQSEIEGMSRRDRKKQETRWRIYDSAMALMEKHGFDAVTIEDICEAADVSNPLFFHHFSNKGALIRNFLERLKVEIAEILAASPEASATEKLSIVNRKVIKSTKNFRSFTPQLVAQMIGGENKLDVEHLDSGITGALGQIIR